MLTHVRLSILNTATHGADHEHMKPCLQRLSCVNYQLVFIHHSLKYQFYCQTSWPYFGVKLSRVCLKVTYS